VIVTAIIFSVVPMIKIYTAFLLFCALGIVTIIAFIKNSKNKYNYIMVLLLAGIIGGVMYAPINLGVGKLIFAPFLFYSHFLESYSPMNNSDWWMRMLVYFEHKNYLRIIENYIILLALFFIPSLSLRVFGLVQIRRIFNKDFYSLQNTFFISAVVLGVFIPSFFIQNIAVFVIVQFLWITYFILLIPAAFGISSLYAITPRFGKIIVLLVMIIISLPDLFSLVTVYARKPLIISSSEVAIANLIKDTVPQKSTLLVLNTHKLGERFETSYTIPIVSALSRHDVYYEPEVLEFSGLDMEVIKRKELISTVDQILSNCSDSKNTNDKIISLLKIAKSNYIVTLDNKPCFQSLPSFILLSQKGEAALYKLR
jgi:hypothetical protein